MNLSSILFLCLSVSLSLSLMTILSLSPSLEHGRIPFFPPSSFKDPLICVSFNFQKGSGAGMGHEGRERRGKKGGKEPIFSISLSLSLLSESE